MEQIFFGMHVRVSRMLSKLAGGKTRVAVETALFATAMTFLMILAVLHVNFVSTHGQHGCFRQYMPPTLPPLMRVGITSDPLPWIHPFGLLFHRVSAKPNRNSFVFAVHKGLLSLLDFPDTNFAGPVNVTLVDVSIPSSSACFGIKHVFDQSPAWTLFLDKFVGYDTIVINQFVHLANGNGYLRHEFSKDVYNLNYATEFQATTATLHSLQPRWFRSSCEKPSSACSASRCRCSTTFAIACRTSSSCSATSSSPSSSFPSWSGCSFSCSSFLKTGCSRS
ncbi:hypothetical protein, variant 2 [Aphanomyces invadans]|uniref:Uncharacterized protein n=1 Tax=Aphanomyces invadans TaxID=157072 RepID=A0A024U7J8_9STRA|nr:hypothetical protein, variant 2 [Aphanomyces invadans]ETW02244.1 hypothetical protein, variant 2 [Aphanomyces invadans]|eukprot:XP_008868849.1 hypothetical protein, variant 2 [Aphanomyces invadans]